MPLARVPQEIVEADTILNANNILQEKWNLKCKSVMFVAQCNVLEKINFNSIQFKL